MNSYQEKAQAYGQIGRLDYGVNSIRDCAPPCEPTKELEALGHDLQSTLEGFHAVKCRVDELAARLIGPRAEQNGKCASAPNPLTTVGRLHEIAGYLRNTVVDLHESIGYLERL